MASTGFDGTVRKWNLKNMQMELSFEDRKAQGRDSVIQSLAWCRMLPPRGQNKDAYNNLVVVGTSAGNVKLIDLVRNKVLQCLNVCANDATVYALDWNSQGILGIGTSENKVLIKKFDTGSM